jgi:hypothetical protein
MILDKELHAKPLALSEHSPIFDLRIKCPGVGSPVRFCIYGTAGVIIRNVGIYHADVPRIQAFLLLETLNVDLYEKQYQYVLPAAAKRYVQFVLEDPLYYASGTWGVSCQAFEGVSHPCGIETAGYYPGDDGG